VGGVRARLTTTLIALVVLTALVLGVGSYLFVDASLHTEFQRAAAAEARFNLEVVIPQTGVPQTPTRQQLEESGILPALRQRRPTIVDVGDVDPAVEVFLRNFSPRLRELVRNGELGYEWGSFTGGRPELAVGGRLPPNGPDFYFIHDATAVEQALGTLRGALLAGGTLLALLALIAARWVARGVLAPVDAASRAAERIERGDLGARVPVKSRDEFGDWAQRFNQMADTLQDTISRLEASQAQNRRFVSDVSHELRTPLTALVAEASILREHLDALPPDARRIGELLIADVARLRGLVEELMELSRFDAAAEKVALEPTDLGSLVRTIVAGRAPHAELVLPDEPLLVRTEPRRLERIVANLVDNAAEHAPGSPVQVRVRTRDGWAFVEVLDRGPGVAPERLERIFDRFYKGDPSRTGGSSGLGLAIAAEHAAVLGGELRAFNRAGGGLRIALRLPVTEPLPHREVAVNERRDRMAPITKPKESRS
jgi:two-component system sensor histidine kinase MtrB